MKKTIAVMVALYIISSLAGCIDGRPPQYSIVNPCAVPDGEGGAVVAYQVNNGQERRTCIQRLGPQGEALWPGDGIDLGPRTGGFTGEQGNFASLVADGRGNATVVYISDSYIWARELDKEGRQVWEGESPTNVPSPAYFKALGNKDGELIIAWASSENHISIQKADSDTGYFITISAPDLDKFDIASDDSGNVFILWKDNPGYSEGNIFVQRVDADGNVSWPTASLQLNEKGKPGYVTGVFENMIIGDGAGGALAVWGQTGQDLYAQHIDNSGKRVWGSYGILIAKTVHDPGIVADASGNAIILWDDLQNAYAQKIDLAGNIIWPEEGIVTGHAGEYDNVIHYYAESDGKGGAVIAWNRADGGDKSLYMQYVDGGGNKLWGDSGIRVSSVRPYWAGYSVPARITTDGEGGFFVTWAAGEHIKDRTSSYIQRISNEGEMLWGEDGIKLDS